MADNNSNTATVAQLLHSGEEEDGCGDIEQGRNIIMSEHTNGIRSSSSSWVAAAITGGKSANTTSTTTTKLPLPLGGLEHADVEDADEARHFLTISNEYTRGLKVKFPPNDTTWAHRHAEDSLYIFLVDGGIDIINHVKGSDPNCDCCEFGEFRYGTLK